LAVFKVDSTHEAILHWQGSRFFFAGKKTSGYPVLIFINNVISTNAETANFAEIHGLFSLMSVVSAFVEKVPINEIARNKRERGASRPPRQNTGHRDKKREDLAASQNLGS
jgi:hypothetical protein